MATKAIPTTFIPALTGFRAVAAFLVFFHHHNPAPIGTFAYCLLNQGYIGVTLFFVLSGFLIYHRYATDFLGHADWSWRRYLRNRFARIFPLYFVLFILTVGLASWLGQPMPWFVFLLNLSLLKGFFNTYKFTGIAQSWSLTVEISFYFIAPFLARLLMRFGVVRLSVGLVSVGLGIWAFISQWLNVRYFTGGFFGTLPFVTFYTFFGRSFEFIVGMRLAQLWHSNRLPALRWTTDWGMCLGLICVIWQASITSCIINSGWLFWSELVVYNYGLPIGVGLFMHGLLFNRSIVSQWLSSSWMQALGRSAYAFHLVHNGVIARGLQRAGLVQEGLLLGLLLLVAYGLYRYFEKPLHAWLRA